MGKIEDKAIDVLSTIIVFPLVVLSVIGGFFIWLGAKIGLIRK